MTPSQVAYITVTGAAQAAASQAAGMVLFRSVPDQSVTTAAAQNAQVLYQASVLAQIAAAAESLSVVAWLNAVMSQTSVAGSISTTGGWYNYSVSDALIARDWVIEEAQILNSVVLSAQRRSIVFLMSNYSSAHSAVELDSKSRTVEFTRVPRRES